MARQAGAGEAVRQGNQGGGLSRGNPGQSFLDKMIAMVEGATCLLDPEGTLQSRYQVAAGSSEPCGAVTPFASGANWFDIPVERPQPSPYGPL